MSVVNCFQPALPVRARRVEIRTGDGERPVVRRPVGHRDCTDAEALAPLEAKGPGAGSQWPGKCQVRPPSHRPQSRGAGRAVSATSSPWCCRPTTTPKPERHAMILVAITAQQGQRRGPRADAVFWDKHICAFKLVKRGSLADKGPKHRLKVPTAGGSLAADGEGCQCVVLLLGMLFGLITCGVTTLAGHGAIKKSIIEYELAQQSCKEGRYGRLRADRARQAPTRSCRSTRT